MHLTPYEVDKLTVATTGMLAQRRLARGLRLSYPEAMGLLAFVLLELIRDGNHSVSELMQIGGRILGRREVLPGVPEMMTDLHVEGTFADGTKLVAVRAPVSHEEGDLGLALHGSFLPVPDTALFGAQAQEKAGTILVEEGVITLNEGRDSVTIDITNTDARPVQIGSHFHFGEANPRLLFDRDAAYGRRLDIPAGTAIRIEPGETRTITLVQIAGNRVIRGGNNIADGQVGAANRRTALGRVTNRAFAHTG
ncbi:urease subunit beta [Swaminathania salitolerans]|uniref:urease n=1 Tax=Swaminathania salitolerans TaxID=182838 RepID=A0A511BN23_9PROT|nr:urease subunit beta [Swaminathania salitolerans]GBQ13784.1 urea amidohydrolase gamma subunit [Swaminathania salitolerans LMG 21291]GEL01736.1 urease subunit gamma/beta [Swaminathania salitolerans]